MVLGVELNPLDDGGTHPGIFDENGLVPKLFDFVPLAEGGPPNDTGAFGVEPKLADPLLSFEVCEGNDPKLGF